MEIGSTDRILARAGSVYATLDVRVLLKKMEQEIDTHAGVEPVPSPQAPDRAGIPGATAKSVEF